MEFIDVVGSTKLPRLDRYNGIKEKLVKKFKENIELILSDEFSITQELIDKFISMSGFNENDLNIEESDTEVSLSFTNEGKVKIKNLFLFLCLRKKMLGGVKEFKWSSVSKILKQYNKILASLKNKDKLQGIIVEIVDYNNCIHLAQVIAEINFIINEIDDGNTKDKLKKINILLKEKLDKKYKLEIESKNSNKIKNLLYRDDFFKEISILGGLHELNREINPDNTVEDEIVCESLSISIKIKNEIKSYLEKEFGESEDLMIAFEKILIKAFKKHNKFILDGEFNVKKPQKDPGYIQD